MRVRLLNRALVALGTAAGITILSFLAIQARPEIAIRELADSRGVTSAEGIAELERTYGLDRPILVRLGEWLGGVVRGDLDDSWSRPGQSVAQVLLEHLPLTLLLTGSGLLVQLFLGLIIAARAMHHRGRWKDALLSREHGSNAN